MNYKHISIVLTFLAVSTLARAVAPISVEKVNPVTPTVEKTLAKIPACLKNETKWDIPVNNYTSISFSLEP